MNGIRGTITFDTIPDGDTLTIDGQTFTFSYDGSYATISCSAGSFSSTISDNDTSQLASNFESVLRSEYNIDANSYGNALDFAAGSVTSSNPSDISVNGFANASPSISQTLTMASGSYTLSFNGANRGMDTQNIQVLVDGSSIDTFSFDTTLQQYTTASFAVVSGTHTISFVPIYDAYSASSGINNLALINNVQVQYAAGNALVTLTDYNSEGLPDTVTDPRGIATETLYDALGRTTATIAAYDPTINSGDSTESNNQTTTYTYDGDDDLLSQTAVMPSGTPNQTTAYVYGVTTASGSAINSNDLLAETEYPDPTTGAASTAAANDVTSTYDALGDQLTMTDRNGTVHTFSYDVLGRLTLDNVTTLGSGVDGTSRAIGTSYNSQGLVAASTSYSDASATTVANQIEYVYNGLGQLTGEYQAVSGAVNTSTTPEVQYAYSDPSTGSLETSMTYPNGRQLDYQYNTLDALLGHVTSIADDADSGLALESYIYLGLNTIVQEDHPETGISLSYIQQPGDTLTSSPGGDQYTGLDQFGRVIDQNYVDTSTDVSTDRFQYGYDQDSNVLYKNNLLNGSESELYHSNSSTSGDDSTAYDPLNRLTTFSRGTLSSSGNNSSSLDTVASTSETQSWSLDALGNWTSSSTNGTSASRTTNSQNEVTAVGSNSLTFDDDGNTTQDESGQKYVYDAWNRLVAVKNSSGTTLQTYSHDALGQRIKEIPASGTATELYYGGEDDWQVLEEKQGSTTTKQNIWSLSYVDDLVLRDDNSTSGNLGKSGSGLGTRLYVQHDANHNVTALLNTSGSVVERFVYDPYGASTVLSSSWSSTTDSNSWQYRYQGGRQDSISGLINFRNRDYSTTLGRWVEQDPAGYVDSLDLFEADQSNPIAGLDAFGLQTGPQDPDAAAAQKYFADRYNDARAYGSGTKDAPYKDMAQALSDLRKVNDAIVAENTEFVLSYTIEPLPKYDVGYMSTSSYSRDAGISTVVRAGSGTPMTGGGQFLGNGGAWQLVPKKWAFFIMKEIVRHYELRTTWTATSKKPITFSYDCTIKPLYLTQKYTTSKDVWVADPNLSTDGLMYGIYGNEVQGGMMPAGPRSAPPTMTPPPGYLLPPPVPMSPRN